MRTVYLEEQGLRVLRFTDLEVLQQLDVVVQAIFEGGRGEQIPLTPFSKECFMSLHSLTEDENKLSGTERLRKDRNKR